MRHFKIYFVAMASLIKEIMDEWEGGSFYTQEYLAEAYTAFLLALLEDAGEVDARAEIFLREGFEAYLREQGGADPQAPLTYRLAMGMIGGRVVTRTTPRSATPPQSPTRSATPCSATPPQTPTRPATPRPTTPESATRSPQPGPSKRSLEDSGEEAEQPTLEILETRERYLKRFKTTFREEVMLIKGLGGTEMPSEELVCSLFDSVLQRQREAVQAKDDDRVIVEIQSTESVENPLWFGLRRTDQLNGRVVLDKLSRVLNSNQSFMINGQLKVTYVHVPTPEAGGRRPNVHVNMSMNDWLKIKIGTKSIFSPSNTADSMCLTRCVAVAKARETVSRHAFYRMKQPNSVIQREEAKALCDRAGIAPDQPCGLDEVRRLQDVMPEYRLCVTTDKDGKEWIFKGEYRVGRKHLYLLLHNGHFYAILFPLTTFGCDYVCEKCVVFYRHRGEHRCEDSCWRCFGPQIHDGPLQRCGDCNHQFAGDECFNSHRTLKLPHTDFTKCDNFKFCPGCERSYSLKRGQDHVCGFVYCRYCKANVRENHLCYMQGWQEREKEDKWKYVTINWDIETTQCDPVDGKPYTFEHKPNLIVCQAVCDACQVVVQNEHFCTVCRTRQQVFHNLDDPNINVMGQFIDYLRSFPAKTELLLVAHNGKSFDTVLALSEMISRKIKPDLILQGAKIICMTVGNWKFIDSLMFLPMPLSAMPKSFGLSELKKGYWPYLANKPEFYTYEGHLLSKHYYCVSGMKARAAADFNAWYDKQIKENFIFNFRRELLEYCVSDVTILRQACQAFRQLFFELAGFDPMFNCITLSSACMAAYRRNFLPEEKIGIVPAGGYHGRSKQSHIALQWLDYESFKLGLKIQTIYTQREVYVMGRPVDGYVEIPRTDGSVERRIYQFHGDFWHQCPRHFPPTADSRENRYENTVRLTALFRRAGYTVVEKWECEFREELKSDPEVKGYFLAHPTPRIPPLILRDALYGGRTCALRSYHKADLTKGEIIKMADVVSMYPSAQLRGAFPYGHPTIYLEGDPQMPTVDQWNGVIQCTVLPPRDLFVPVLPYRSGGKLMFPLCRTCAETEGNELCRHDDPALRQLTGTWCAPELQLAVL